MSKIPFFNSFGKKSSTNRTTTIVDTVAAELLQTPLQPPVDTPATPIGGVPTVKDRPHDSAVRPSGKFICEACPPDVAKPHSSPATLASHVQNQHPSEWPFQLIIPKSKNYAKKWKPVQVKMAVDAYLQLRAEQNIGRHFVINGRGSSVGPTIHVGWVDSLEQPDTSSSSHIKALNAASVLVGRNTKSVRDVLNGTLPLINGVVKHQPVLVRQLGGVGALCELTAYGRKRIKQIRDKCGYVGSGGIEGLESVPAPTTTIQQPKQSDSVVEDSTVIQPQETQETTADSLVWNTEPSNIVSTWAGLTDGVLKYVSELQQQVSDLKNQDHNRIDKEDTFLKEMEAKDNTIVQKDQIIASQKKHIIELDKNGEIGKERNELVIQVQNLTEERDTLFTANQNLVQQAKAHNKEKQSATIAKKGEVQSLKNRVATILEDLENMKKDWE